MQKDRERRQMGYIASQPRGKTEIPVNAMKHWRITAALLGMGMICAPAFSANAARPGAVNYIEGTAYLDGRQLNNQDVDSAELDAGQVLTTSDGKAEVLLAPGIFLRLDDYSAVRMIPPDVTQTQVEIEQGRAAVEVDQIFPQNQVQIVDGGVTTQVVKPGYYEFDATHPEAMVFKGQAEVEVGNEWVRIKDHHELDLSGVAEGAHEKTANFDTRGAQDELYNWSILRSQYLAEADNEIADLNIVNGALTNAADNLLKAANQSDYVQKAIAGIDQALDDTKQAAAFVHDDSAATAPTASPNFDAPPPPAPRINFMLYSSLNNLKLAYDALNRVPGGDFGGYRTRINDDIAAAADVLVNGIASFNARHPR
jgi:hypothetical protein